MKNKKFSFMGAILVGISLLMAGLTFSTMACEPSMQYQTGKLLIEHDSQY